MSLFKHGNFTLHSGGTSWWQIDCDDLSETEIGIFARLIAEKVGNFSHVVCPKSHYGSAAPKLVIALQRYRSGNNFILIVDDVVTTGGSMNALREQYEKDNTKGACMFARDECPDWIYPVWKRNLR